MAPTRRSKGQPQPKTIGPDGRLPNGRFGPGNTVEGRGRKPGAGHDLAKAFRDGLGADFIVREWVKLYGSADPREKRELLQFAADRGWGKATQPVTGDVDVSLTLINRIPDEGA